MNNPAAIALPPNPTPLLLGSSISCGITAIDAYIPTPSRNAARFVVQTARVAIIRMSTSGWRERSSRPTQAATTAAAPANSPTVLVEPQPHVLASLTDTSRPARPIAISAAEPQLMFAEPCAGERGTHTIVSGVVTARTASGSQNSQW